MSTIAVEEKIMDRFKRLMLKQRLAHAYLFVGPAGIGKKASALTIAMLVNCQDALKAPCGVCSSCMKITSGNHPDVYLLGSDEGIKIDDIRQMLGRLGLRAFEAQVKVFILQDADRMTNEAANSLLKALEEPAPHTLIILTSSAPQNCLDTIKSRCHTVPFFQIQDSLMVDREKILDVFLTKTTTEDFVKQLSADKSVTAAAMQVLFVFVRDVALHAQGVASTHLVFRNRIKDIEGMSHRGMDDLNALTQQIVRTKELANENLNVKMALSLVRQRLWGN